MVKWKRGGIYHVQLSATTLGFTWIGYIVVWSQHVLIGYTCLINVQVCLSKTTPLHVDMLYSVLDSNSPHFMGITILLYILFTSMFIVITYLWIACTATTTVQS